MDYSKDNMTIQASIFMANKEKIEQEELYLNNEFKMIHISNEKSDYIIK